MKPFENASVSITDKNGRLILPVLQDMRYRENAVLICNFAGDCNASPINAYIAKHYAEETTAGIVELAKAGGCADVIIYSGDTDTAMIVESLQGQSGLNVTVITGPASPVLREDTALYSAIDTGIVRCHRAEQEYQSEFLSFGYHCRPTLVVDGETVYQTGRLCKSPDAAATKLVAIVNSAVNSELIEGDIGTSAYELLKSHNIEKPVLIGDGLGRFIDMAALETTFVEFLNEWDSIRIFEANDCPVNALAEIYRNNSELSCRKCVMCREGSRQLELIFSDITNGRANRDDAALIEEISPLIQAGALCDFGKSMASPAISATKLCREELTVHIANRSCSAGQCVGLLGYVIDPVLCTGCEECLDVCPEEAIEGEKGYIHIIDTKLCIKCGKCIAACTAGAIKKGGNIRVPKRSVKVGQFR